MQKNNFGRLLNLFTETFGLGRIAALGAILLIGVATLLAVFLFLKSAPPTSLILTSGPEGSLFQTNAEKYRVILARNGVTLRVLPSRGSLENLERLQNSALRVDVGFVQGGVTNGNRLDKLVSLGSIAYQPLLVFYRGTTTVELLSGLTGKKLAIGPVGSGTHSLALTLLAAEPASAFARLGLPTPKGKLARHSTITWPGFSGNSGSGALSAAGRSAGGAQLSQAVSHSSICSPRWAARAWCLQRSLAA